VKVASMFLLVSMLPMVFSLSSVGNVVSTTSVNTIVVPTDYPTIQAAIDAAPDNSTIMVKPGNYTECITIKKPLNLIGSGANSTMIESAGQAQTVAIPPGVNGVVLKGFTIKGEGESPWSGIYTRESNNDTIENNVVEGNCYGIQIYDSSGIVLRNNTMVGNAYNLRVWGLFLSHFLHDIDTSNSVEGKPVIYWVNRKGMSVPPNAGYVALVNCTRMLVKGLNFSRNLAGVFMGYTTDSLIMNVTASSNEIGLYMICSYNNTIVENDFSHNSIAGISTVSAINNTIVGNEINLNGQDGVRLSHSYPILGSYSENNTFCGNVVKGNWDGVYLEKTFNNVVEGNTVEENIHSGMTLDGSSGNSISRNTIGNNKCGVLVYTSSDSLFHNRFVNNSVQAAYDPFSPSSSNAWDGGYPTGGNYWSNYNGSDLRSGPYQNETGGDGLGDAPYVINEYNKDRYPLMSLNVETVLPRPNFTYSPVDALVSKNVNFSDESIDVGGEILARVWKVQENYWWPYREISIGFEEEGNYSVTLTVFDFAGASRSVTKNLNVRRYFSLLSLSVPKRADAGDTVGISARLLDESGFGLSNATIVFSLGNGNSQERIQSATTNSSGIVTIFYTASKEGNFEVEAQYQGSRLYAGSEAAETLVVVTSNSYLLWMVLVVVAIPVALAIGMWKRRKRGR
jgi:parallel beta-helix repeat protein